MLKARSYFPPIDFKHRFSSLDGIRGLAVTAVFFFHYGGGAHGGLILNFINFVRLQGWMGVDIFFVLSGFLITGILYDTRHDSHFFKRFFARRSLRIFPVFYLVVAVLLILTPILHYQWRAGHLLFLIYMGNFLANHDFSYYGAASPVYPIFHPEISHFWSLCVEEQFYLLWPVVVWLVKDRIRLIWVAGVLSAGVFFLRIAIYQHLGLIEGEAWVLRTLPYRADTLLLGGMLALLLRGPAADRIQRSCNWLFLAGAAGVAAVVVLLPTHLNSLFLSLRLTLVAIASVALIGLTLRPGSVGFRVFSFEPLRILGKYSYGFYIFHYIYNGAWISFLIVLERRLHSLAIAGLIALGLNFGLTFLAAKLSYDFFEVKFLRFKEHFEYDSEVSEHRHAFIAK